MYNMYFSLYNIYNIYWIYIYIYLQNFPKIVLWVTPDFGHMVRTKLKKIKLPINAQ